MTFDMLNDDVLLQIFEFYVDEDMDIKENWMTLIHVCRRWRSIVFQSPRHLNLRLHCTPKKQMRDTLDIWPPLPLVIRDFFTTSSRASVVYNFIAALEHNDRVYQIKLNSSQTLKNVVDLAALQKPFSELTHLKLGTYNNDGPMLPDSFLGGATPRLRSLVLFRIPFPGLPNLLSSATHLVELNLHNIPPSGYIPPEVMATSLSSLTSLEKLSLRFRTPRPGMALDGQSPLPPPPTRSVLPSLIKIDFKGASKYLEEILARIDAPRLKRLRLTVFDEFVFDTPQLFQFISRRPTLRAPEKCQVTFSSNFIVLKFLSQTFDYGALIVEIPCTGLGLQQLSSFEQICASSLPPLSMLEDLYLVHEDPALPPYWLDNVDDMLWLRLLHPFAAVKNLYLYKKLVSRVTPALQELVGERTTEVLPALENIFLEGFKPSWPFLEGIEEFVAARRLTNHFVAVSSWNRYSEQKRQGVSWGDL